MPLFNKKRKQLVRERRFSDYLRYAIGEIVLVVIGILIALQINTLNAERKNHKEWLGIIEQVRRDMVEDTVSLHLTIQYYEEIKPMYRKLLRDSLSFEELRSCGYCRGFGMNYAPFHFKQSGFRALERAPAKARTDSLSMEVLSFYNSIIETLPDIEEKVGNDALGTNTYLRDNYPWFSDKTVFSQKLSELQLEDPFYRNRLSFHYVLIYSNYSLFLEAVLNDERDFIERLRKRLEQEGYE